MNEPVRKVQRAETPIKNKLISLARWYLVHFNREWTSIAESLDMFVLKTCYWQMEAHT